MNFNHTAFKMKQEERDHLNKKANKEVDKAIQEMLKDRIKSLDNLGESSLELPNWPLLRAYRDGRIRELEELLKIYQP